MLTVYIASLSLLKNEPPKDSRHGGGFVFDCRFLPNPGRDKRMRTLTGQDEPVNRYLASMVATTDFKTAVLTMVEPAIKRYLERDFDTLLVSFGCTGGQHRSVFFAEWLNEHLKARQQNGSALTTSLAHLNAANWVRE